MALRVERDFLHVVGGGSPGHPSPMGAAGVKGHKRLPAGLTLAYAVTAPSTQMCRAMSTEARLDHPLIVFWPEATL